MNITELSVLLIVIILAISVAVAYILTGSTAKGSLNTKSGSPVYYADLAKYNATANLTVVYGLRYEGADNWPEVTVYKSGDFYVSQSGNFTQYHYGTGVLTCTGGSCYVDSYEFPNPADGVERIANSTALTYLGNATVAGQECDKFSGTVENQLAKKAFHLISQAAYQQNVPNYAVVFCIDKRGGYPVYFNATGSFASGGIDTWDITALNATYGVPKGIDLPPVTLEFGSYPNCTATAVSFTYKPFIDTSAEMLTLGVKNHTAAIITWNGTAYVYANALDENVSFSSGKPLVFNETYTANVILPVRLYNHTIYNLSLCAGTYCARTICEPGFSP